MKINKEDIISINDVIEKKIIEKDVEERTRKTEEIIWFFLELKNVKQWVAKKNKK